MAPTYHPAKLFTPEQANAMLPLVSAIVSDLVKLTQEVVERRQRLTSLLAGRDLEDGDPYEEELSEVERELERDSDRIREYAKELSDLGVELKDPLTGLVDFPWEFEGRTVFLCWRLGELRITHWHEVDAGFQGRNPVPEELA